MVFPDDQSVENASIRARFEDFWGTSLDPKAGLTVVEIINAILAGQVRGMYIMGENPAMSDPDQHHARQALATLEHLVVQDIFLTETAFHADVVLPASAFPEKDGTFTNTNRQVQMGRTALPMPGQVRQDWELIQEIARRVGLDWAYAHPRDVFAEMHEVMPSIKGMSWDRVDREDSVVYPVDAEDEPGHEVLFGDGFPTASGRGRFVPADVLPPDEVPDSVYPLILTTGRVLEHWHTGAMTRRADVLDAIEPEPMVHVHPGQLAEMGIRAGDMVEVTTRRGSISLTARADRDVPRGVLFIPFAYNEAAANVLTNPKLDPFGKIPEFKYCAARLRALAEAAE
jgi:formate dehydrogenase major subunit